MKKFEGISLATDLDGTLLKSDKTISIENIKAIEYFKSEGGLFTFITGRIPEGIKPVFDVLKPNAPIGCINGAGVYDIFKQEFLWCETLSPLVLELVEYVDKSFPQVGIEVILPDKIYFCKDNQSTIKHRKDEDFEPLKKHYKDVDEPFSKILFADEYSKIDELSKALSSHPLCEKFDFVRSDLEYYEIMPKGIGKGDALNKLSEITGIDKKNIIAVGDNDNDVTMLQTAGISFAVENASKKAKEAADYITVSNEEHALKAIIDMIDKKEIL